MFEDHDFLQENKHSCQFLFSRFNLFRFLPVLIVNFNWINFDCINKSQFLLIFNKS